MEWWCIEHISVNKKKINKFLLTVGFLIKIAKKNIYFARPSDCFSLIQYFLLCSLLYYEASGR